LGLPAVRADLRLVKKALAQLLENASKYSQPEEPIAVCVEMNGDFLMTSVIDQGNGIEVHEQHLIFDELYRGKDQRHLSKEREWDCLSRRLSLKCTAAR
jgi:two-component system sensor histidine kinase KdpD